MERGDERRALTAERHIEAPKVCDGWNARACRDQVWVPDLHRESLGTRWRMEDRLAVVAYCRHAYGIYFGRSQEFDCAGGEKLAYRMINSAQFKQRGGAVFDERPHPFRERRWIRRGRRRHDATIISAKVRKDRVDAVDASAGH
jgi:hypothetical protein